MGIIRLLLALSVVSAHSNSNPLLKFIGGEVAVEAFFIISGFYMAMVYGSYDSKLKFWKSRYLRLYPTYIFCALFALIFLRDGFSFISQLTKLPTSAGVFLIFTNLTIFLQDVTMFIGTSGGDAYFTKNFRISSPPLWTFLLVPQAWSLGLELSFYLMVPFLLNKSSKVLVAIVLASTAIKISLQHIGFSINPWSYRFFPSELAMFLLGSISFKIYNENDKTRSESLNWLVYGAVIGFILFFPSIPLEYQSKKIIFYVLLIFSLGTVFELTKSVKIDNFIGLLSYPMYCCHLIVIGFILPKIKFWSNDAAVLPTLFLFLAVILSSVFIYFLIEKPVDIYRLKYKHRR